MAVILGEACNGAPPEQVATLQDDIVFDFFGKTISMGKGRGLMGIVNRVAAAAKQQLS